MPTSGRLFLSYARRDRADLDRLAGALRLLRHEPWFDESLSGGQSWWDEILDQIRTCAALLTLVSPDMLRSHACLAEVDYAIRLGKPVLPVAIRPVDLALLPPSVARLHVQRLDDTQDSAFRFAAAVQEVLRGEPRPPGADPVPPAAPMSYLTALADRVRAPTLGLDEQFALVARIEDAVENAEDVRGLPAVVAAFAARDDLFHQVGRRVENLRRALAPAAPVAVPVEPPAGPVADGVTARLVEQAADRRVWLREAAGRTHQLGFHKTTFGTKLVFDDRRVADVQKTVRIRSETHRFTLAFDGDTATPCELRWTGMGEIKGTALSVDGHQVHADGTLA